MPRLRFRVRTLMLIVAYIAAVIGAGIPACDVYSNWVSFRWLAASHGEEAAEIEQALKEGRDYDPLSWCGYSGPPPWPAHPSAARIAEMRRRATSHKAMQARYERAAFRPWLLTPSDL
jgi:hypothetical protein